MRMRDKARRAAALANLALVACSTHEERHLADWLKVDVARPVTGTSGVIVLGSSEEVFRSRVGETWSRVGSGHPCRYMLLAGEQAALIDLNDKKGVQVIRSGETAPRPLQDVFGRSGDFSVVPGGAAIDFFECRTPARPAGCSDVQIHRHDLNGTRLDTFLIPRPEAYGGCQLMTIRGYDAAGAPYVSAQCAMDSPSAKCLLLAARKDGLFVHAVGQDRPWKECSDFPRLGVSLKQAERFQLF